jgi:hypothetical protein
MARRTGWAGRVRRREGFRGTSGRSAESINGLVELADRIKWAGKVGGFIPLASVIG